MQVLSTHLAGVKILAPRRFGDSRGWFSETWNRQAFADAGIEVDFFQDNLSFSANAGTVRGLHFQLPPMSQAKLTWVPRGKVLDVVADIDPASPTFRQHVAIELGDEDGRMLYIPAGYAHGVCTLVPDVLFAYKVGAPYSVVHERTIHWQDPEIGISWPVSPRQAHLSSKDDKAPTLAEFLSSQGAV